MWNPAATEIFIWQPSSGWPSVFNNRDKVSCITHYEYFMREKKYSSVKAEKLAMKKVYKDKFPELEY
jgi:hypothetical protein